jgi:hypothetical protein
MQELGAKETRRPGPGGSPDVLPEPGLRPRGFGLVLGLRPLRRPSGWAKGHQWVIQGVLTFDIPFLSARRLLYSQEV